jgi:hypothetical protein
MKQLVEIKVDNKELAQYLEALFEDVQKSMDGFTKELKKDRKADLVVPNSFFQKMNDLKDSFSSLAKKDFKLTLDGMDGFNRAMSDVSIGLQALKNFKAPQMPAFPTIPAPVVNMDLKSLETKLDSFIESLRNTMIQAELTNLNEMPMVLTQHASKNLAEANPLVHALTLTNNNEEYSQAITGPTKGFIMQGRGDYDIKIKFSAGGNYWTIKSGSALDIGGYHPTVYAESATAGAVLEIIEIH